VRQDLGASLSMRSVLAILQRFQPDEFAADAISPDVLEALEVTRPARVQPPLSRLRTRRGPVPVLFG
jgi:hypothetical protein